MNNLPGFAHLKIDAMYPESVVEMVKGILKNFPHHEPPEELGVLDSPHFIPHDDEPAAIPAGWKNTAEVIEQPAKVEPLNLPAGVNPAMFRKVVEKVIESGMRPRNGELQGRFNLMAYEADEVGDALGDCGIVGFGSIDFDRAREVLGMLEGVKA